MNFKNVLLFLGGGALGASVAWFFTKRYYEKLIRSIDIPSIDPDQPYDVNPIMNPPEEPVKNEVQHDISKLKNAVGDSAITPNYTQKPDIMDYAKKVDQYDYANLTSSNPMAVYQPHAIRPEEMGTLEGYQDSYICYYQADDVICDEDFKPYTDQEQETYFGNFRLEFDKYEEDVCYIRNEQLQIDYKIERYPGRFEDAVDKLRGGPQED